MMKLRLLKLAKRLNKFSLDDILIMTEENEQDLINALNSLIEEGSIKKIDEINYLFISATLQNQQKITDKKRFSNNRIVFSKEELENLNEQKETLAEYKNAPGHVKARVNKYLNLLKEAHNLYDKDLRNYIENIWNKKYPKATSSVTSYSRARKKLKEIGLIGIIPSNFILPHSNSWVDDELYEELRQYIMENRGKTLKTNYVRHKKIYLASHPEMESWEYPSYDCIVTRIKSDIIKFKDNLLSECLTHKKIQQTEFKINTAHKRFKDAAEDFIKLISSENKLKQSTIKSYTGYLRNHLIPFFKNSWLDDIDLEMVELYKKATLELNMSPYGIHKHLAVLRIILKNYSIKNKNFSLSRSALDASINNDKRILDETELKILFKITQKHCPDFYPLLFTAVTTGLTRGEILGLTWDKIKWNKKKIIIDQSLYQGKIIKHKARSAVRNLEITGSTLQVLKKWQVVCPKGDLNLVFPNKEGNPKDPDNMIKREFYPLVEKVGIKKVRFIDLRDTYAYLLLKQNQPIHYVQSQLGHSSVKVTYDRYFDLLPKNNKKTDIFENISG